MSRINFGARHEYESLTNYKVLQNVFNKNRISKPIPVDRLVRCKMQDNLEFLQWIKLSLIHISEPTRHSAISRMPSSA